MHITCPKEDLLKGIQSVSKAVSNKAILPILSNILFDCSDGQKLKLSSTDLEIGIETYLDVNINLPGKITIPARILSEVISKLPNNEIELHVNESNTETKLKCNRLKYDIKSIEASDFPPIPQIDENNIVNVKPEIFAQSIKKSIFAASSDASKNILNGINVIFSENKIEMAATDGYRLAVKKIDIESNNEQGFSVIVPSRSLNELSRLLASASEESILKVSQLANQIVFNVDGKTLSTRLIEGQYPDYKKIIPNNLDTVIVLDRLEFLNTVDRVAAISSIDKVNVISLNIMNGKMELSSRTPESGESFDYMDIEYEGDSFQINFNARFLIDALKNFDDDHIKLMLGGSLSPGIIRPIEDDSYFCMVMPIRS